MATRWRDVETPLGTVRIAASQKGDVTAEFTDLHDEPPPGEQDPTLLPDVATWIAEALLRPVGPPPIPVPEGPPFRRACWTACRSIPLGETRTYGELAAMAGKPAAARAAGTAMRTNPMALLTPCHRVVGASDLGGYAGARRDDTPNLRLKRRLLELEAAIASRPPKALGQP